MAPENTQPAMPLPEASSLALGHSSVGGFMGGVAGQYLEDHPRTCKWLVNPIYKP